MYGAVSEWVHGPRRAAPDGGEVAPEELRRGVEGVRRVPEPRVA
jgi:hypothetical protein